MRLKLLVPTHVVIDQDVTKVTAEAEHGSFCLLPRHVDYMAALVPGLLGYEDDAGERFAAVDEGVLVKRGEEVLVSTRQAILGGELGQLRRVVHEQLEVLDEHARAAQSAVSKLESTSAAGT